MRELGARCYPLAMGKAPVGESLHLNQVLMKANPMSLSTGLYMDKRPQGGVLHLPKHSPKPEERLKGTICP